MHCTEHNEAQNSCLLTVESTFLRKTPPSVVYRETITQPSGFVVVIATCTDRLELPKYAHFAKKLYRTKKMCHMEKFKADSIHSFSTKASLFYQL